MTIPRKLEIVPAMFCSANNDEKEISFFIGDSFVHGSCVDEQNTIPIIFEEKTNITSFNIGNGSTDGIEYQGKMINFVKMEFL